MAGFFDYLRGVMGWWSAPASTPLVSDKACFTLAVEQPLATLSVEIPSATLELLDCC